jgi:5-methylcytosine-specific restriction endonuclease McrA
MGRERFEDRKATIKFLRLRDGDKCWLCKNLILFWPDCHPQLGSVTVDHLLPVSKGGTNDDYNLRLAHYKCNTVRSDSIDPEQIGKAIQALLEHPELNHRYKWTEVTIPSSLKRI